MQLVEVFRICDKDWYLSVYRQLVFHLSVKKRASHGLWPLPLVYGIQELPLGASVA